MRTVDFIESLAPPLWESHHGKGPFLRSLPQNAKVLDVGCGNNSPVYVKHIRPDLYYIGIDVGDYNHDANSIASADEYHVSESASFVDTIGKFAGSIDAVVSSHNLEHCDDYKATLRAMSAALKPGGRLFLSFPCEASAHFPHRAGCLNFYDDTTHQNLLPWKSVNDELGALGLTIEFKARRYRPLSLALIGAILEPVSLIERRVRPSGATWALYGFESVIWARS